MTMFCQSTVLVLVVNLTLAVALAISESSGLGRGRGRGQSQNNSVICCSSLNNCSIIRSNGVKKCIFIL